MKTLVSILMTILGILSPALSSQAQEADLFPGEFKEIYSINDFTEGYYIICYQQEKPNLRRLHGGPLHPLQASQQ